VRDDPVSKKLPWIKAVMLILEKRFQSRYYTRSGGVGPIIIAGLMKKYDGCLFKKKKPSNPLKGLLKKI